MADATLRGSRFAYRHIYSKSAARLPAKVVKRGEPIRDDVTK
jgi:hypothetical protein